MIQQHQPHLYNKNQLNIYQYLDSQLSKTSNQLQSQSKLLSINNNNNFLISSHLLPSASTYTKQTGQQNLSDFDAIQKKLKALQNKLQRIKNQDSYINKQIKLYKNNKQKIQKYNNKYRSDSKGEYNNIKNNNMKNNNNNKRNSYKEQTNGKNNFYEDQRYQNNQENNNTIMIKSTNKTNKSKKNINNTENNQQIISKSHQKFTNKSQKTNKLQSKKQSKQVSKINTPQNKRTDKNNENYHNYHYDNIKEEQTNKKSAFSIQKSHNDKQKQSARVKSASKSKISYHNIMNNKPNFTQHQPSNHQIHYHYPHNNNLNSTTPLSIPSSLRKSSSQCHPYTLNRHQHPSSCTLNNNSNNNNNNNNNSSLYTSTNILHKRFLQSQLNQFMKQNQNLKNKLSQMKTYQQEYWKIKEIFDHSEKLRKIQKKNINNNNNNNNNTNNKMKINNYMKK